MSWPNLEGSVKAVDLSWYQNTGWPLRKPFDVDLFCAENPDVELAIVRVNWPGGSPDQHFAHYYDGFERNGVKTLAYVWSNVNHTIQQIEANWKRALDGREPKALLPDHETWSGNENASKLVLTRDLHRSVELAERLFSGEVVVKTSSNPYSRGGWLDAHIIPSAQVDGYKWWLAHYPYPPQYGGNRQVTSFDEMDPLLPIDNNFTPWRGRVHSIPSENVVGWQFSSKGALEGALGSIDLNYFRRSFVETLFDEQPPEPPEPPPAEKVPVEIVVPAGKVNVTITER